MNNYLIYQAYGKLEILQECIYSITQLLQYYKAKNSPFKIVVVTDNVPYFQQYLAQSEVLIYEPISIDKFNEWKGAINFVHRVKIEVLQYITAKYNGNYLYADTDIYFLQPIDELFNQIAQGKHLMCFKEWGIAEGKNILYKRLNKFIQSKANITPIKPSDVMYNAGILGFNESFIPSLQKVLELTDKLHPLHPIFIIEQLAFSYVMQLEAPVIPTEKIYTYHYWNFKEFRQVLANVFAKYNNSETIAKALVNIKVDAMHQPKLAYEKLPSIQRKLMKLLGKTWQMPRVD